MYVQQALYIHGRIDTKAVCEGWMRKRGRSGGGKDRERGKGGEKRGRGREREREGRKEGGEGREREGGVCAYSSDSSPTFFT